jgi:glycine betaine/choline ABC-type transport system substrate-binding protein
MAIQANVILSNGISLTNAYIIIDVQKSKVQFNGCKINVWIYVNEAKRIANIPVVFGSILVGQDDPDYLGYFSESFLKENETTDTEQGYKYVKIKDGELEERLGFNIDWENVIDI